ncbi:MAG: hypothetical protein HY360_25605, partial [Verrucomicrobia bacterium]|nr:hypothetical protein [Verrucomicrobiota bacterium]
RRAVTNASRTSDQTTVNGYGFWNAEPLTVGEVKKLKPVDIASLPFSEWILQRMESLKKKYGKAEIGQLVEGSVNAASRIRGAEFFYDLAADKEMSRRLLEVITQTVILTYQ